MEKKLIALEKKIAKVFNVFEKMIIKLTGHNESLQQIIDEARDEINKHQAIIDAATKAMGANQEQISKIETFIGAGKGQTTNDQSNQQ